LDDEVIAVKVMRLDESKPPREVTVHEDVPLHENIPTPLWAAYNSDRHMNSYMYICMELANESLFQFLHSSKIKPSFEQSIKWALQVAKWNAASA